MTGLLHAELFGKPAKSFRVQQLPDRNLEVIGVSQMGGNVSQTALHCLDLEMQ